MRNRLDTMTSAAPATTRTRGPVDPKRRVCLAAAALLAVLGSAVVASPVAGQESAGDVEVRIVARKLDTGRIEFGLQQRQTDNT